jgi:predicted acylesterase/phospholipase RssA
MAMAPGPRGNGAAPPEVEGVPLPPRACDLVMKGGITSGIVYPSAVIELAKRYWFARIGGASAGAIAAALTAAAEYSRRPEDSTDIPPVTPGEDLPELEVLEPTIEQLGKPGFLLGLFQPTVDTRPFFQVFLLLVDKDRPVWNRALGAAGVMLSYVWWALIAGLLITFSYAVIYTQGVVDRLPAVTSGALIVVGWAAVTFWIVALCVLRRSFGTEELSPKRRRVVEALGVAGSLVAGLLLLRLRGPLPAGVEGRIEALVAALLGLAVLAAFAATAVTWALVCSVAVVAPKAKRELEKNGFGMCTGLKVDPKDTEAGPGVTEWLHERIQTAAKRSIDDPPVTFEDLESRGIGLEMITTDLSYGRPLRLPLEEGEGPKEGYIFKPAEWANLFPERVVSWMTSPKGGACRPTGWRPAPATSGGAPGYCLPTKKMPILVAARLSLSFPGLISAVPVHSLDPSTGRETRHWFSDGGISSNFPIHFFDGWMPRHPTFGLTLPPQEEDEQPVFLPRWDDPIPLRTKDVRGIVSFVGQIVDTMQNWRDNSQAELAGYRERICQIRMRDNEGGANLSMSPTVIQGLVERGRSAGEKILTKFDDDAWSQHLVNRYISLLNVVHEGMRQVGTAFGEEVRFGEFLGAGAPGTEIHKRPESWPMEAAEATRAVIKAAAECELFEGRSNDPRPQPLMRMAPRA